MSYETDERLKSPPDANQLHREQMCLAVMAIDRRFQLAGALISSAPAGS
jgi:hypothetical protein